MFACSAVITQAQILRLGPLDVDSSLELALIFTTNVDLERESESEFEREDYYAIFSVNLLANVELTANTDVDIDTGISVEKHLNREDLDNSERPFARGKIATLTELGRFTLDLEAGYERTSESQEDTAFTGESSLSRRESEETYYGGELFWDIDWFNWNAFYDFSQLRYLDEDEEIGDKDTTEYGFGAELFVTDDVSLSYTWKRTLDELINEPADDPEWKTEQEILANFYLLEKPNFIYSFGYKKEDEGDVEGDWEQTHKFAIDDEFQLTKSILLSYAASYDIEEVEDDDDIGFTYSLTLTHEISDRSVQIFSLKREPVNTFGSTTDTDSTVYSYVLKIDDFFIYDVNFSFDTSYTIDEPLGEGETEKTFTYAVGLEHKRQLNTSLSRELAYMYTYEDSNLEEEILDEHRVTLTYIYVF